MGPGWLPAKTEPGELRAEQASLGWQQLPVFVSTGPLWAEHFNERVFFSVYFHRVRLISCSKHETLAWKWHICQLKSTVDVQRANRISCCGKSWVTVWSNSVFFVSDTLRVSSKRIPFLLEKRKKPPKYPNNPNSTSWRKMLWCLPTNE